jgi:type II secretory pathway pseudopilin PulG
MKKLKGNTLVEVLIALSITSFCSALAVVIFLSIQKSSLPFFKLKAIELTQKYMQQALEKRELSEDTYRAEEFSIKKTVSRNEAYPDCFNIRVIAFDASRKKLYELEGCIYKGK